MFWIAVMIVVLVSFAVRCCLSAYSAKRFVQEQRDLVSALRVRVAEKDK